MTSWPVQVKSVPSLGGGLRPWLSPIRSFSRQSYTLFITFISPFQNISTTLFLCLPLLVPSIFPAINTLFSIDLLKCPKYFYFLTFTVSNNFGFSHTISKILSILRAYSTPIRHSKHTSICPSFKRIDSVF